MLFSPAKQEYSLFPQKHPTRLLRSQGIMRIGGMKTIFSRLSPASQCVPPQKKCETGRSQSLLEAEACDSLRKAVSQQNCPRRIPGTNDQAKKRDRDTPGKREEEEIENCPGYYSCPRHRPVTTWARISILTQLVMFATWPGT